uniref:Uncharacterized protein n=1 Tax=Syphacia muris TaxID=451379 RepID=A0A0N5A9I4_9BILA
MALPFIGSLAFFNWCRSLNCQRQQFEDGDGGVISIIGMHLSNRRDTLLNESAAATDVVSIRNLLSDGFHETLPNQNDYTNADIEQSSSTVAAATANLSASNYPETSSIESLTLRSRLRSSTLRKQRKQSNFGPYGVSAESPTQSFQYTGQLLLMLISQ